MRLWQPLPIGLNRISWKGHSNVENFTHDSLPIGLNRISWKAGNDGCNGRTPHPTDWVKSD